MNKLQIEIIFEDEHILVINKPSKVLSIPDRWDATKDSVYHILAAKRIGLMVIHRLDRDTSGIMVFAKNAEAHRNLNEQFSSHQTEKTYWALVSGQVHDGGEINTPIAADPYHAGKMMVHKKGKAASTTYTPIELFSDFTLLKVVIQTGRTHQIRVHLQSIGIPLALDPLYGSESPITIRQIKKRNLRWTENPEVTDAETALMARVPLHAVKLGFLHPFTKNQVEFEAALPKDFKALLQQLRKWGR
ncbi:MAG: RluA family pseudouridine synthase [Saprospiraceae bacterium]|nr:RluA family pseudouridine synthase [Saprospiraceae bacterium]